MSRKEQLDNLGVSAFCESLGMLMEAGSQTHVAISLLGQGEHGNGPLAKSIDQMVAATEEGKRLSEAMEETGIFPDYAVQMIAAGETSGRLDEILLRLSEYYAGQKTISDQIRSAIIYPATMIGLIIAVLAVLRLMVLPVFSGVYENLTGSLSASSYNYINLAYTFCNIALIVMIVIAVMLVGGLILWNNGKRSTVEGFLQKIPSCASILENLGLYRFTSALETYLASGEMQDEAIKNSIAMTNNKPVEERLAKCVSEMDEGHSFAQAAYNAELYEPIYGRMLLPGERSGNLEGVLQRLTKLLETNCSNQVTDLVNTVEPMLSGILMISVALCLLSVMLPLIGMMNSIG